MVNQTFGTKRKNAYEIFEDCLNMQSTTVRDRQEYINEKGNKSVKYVVNAQETMIARAKQQQIQEAFASWVWKNRSADSFCVSTMKPSTQFAPVSLMGAISYFPA